MPPAAPSYAGAMSPENKHRKKLDSLMPSATLRRIKKSELRKDENDVRTMKKHRVLERCEDEDDIFLGSSKRRRINGKFPISKPRKEPGTHSGDANIALSGEEDNSEELDFIDYSSDEESERSIESTKHEENLAPLNRKKKKYYVVQNDGRPAELYRTDLIHSLRNGEDFSEDSDEECGAGYGMLRLTDRWREEWNHGVQVAMNPRALPSFEIVPSSVSFPVRGVFRMPIKYIGIRPEGSAPSFYVSPATHACSILPKRFLYQCDRLDEIWLEEINKSRIMMGKTKINIFVFTTVMDALEVSCYERIHQLLLAPLNSPNFDEVDEEAACDICRGAESEPDDNMVFCDGCNMCVHMSCYGLTHLPEEEWICQKCALGYGFSPPCLLCPTRGGALKCTKKMDDSKRRWAHVACALWIPECRFGNAELREPITNIDEIPDERWQMKCCICDTRQGACIQCTFPSCRTSFHVTCALRSGMEMRIDQDPDPNVDAVRFLSFCPRHSEKGGVVEEDKQSDDECDIKENKELRRLENYFYLHVDYEFISKCLNVDLLMVSDIYEYWKLKRSENGGKPLVRNPHDEIKLEVESVPALMLPQQYGPVPEDITSNNTFCSLRSGRLRTSLDKGRNLLCVIVKREKEKHRDILTQWQILENIWEQIMLGVPLSQRVIDSFCEIIESLLDPSTLEGVNKMIDNFKNLDEIKQHPYLNFKKTGGSDPIREISNNHDIKMSSTKTVVSKRSKKVVVSLPQKDSDNNRSRYPRRSLK